MMLFCPSTSSWWNQVEDDAGGQRELWGKFDECDEGNSFSLALLMGKMLIDFLKNTINFRPNLGVIYFVFLSKPVATKRVIQIIHDLKWMDLSISECDIFASVLHLFGTHHTSLPHISSGWRGAVSSRKTNTGVGHMAWLCTSSFTQQFELFLNFQWQTSIFQCSSL